DADRSKLFYVAEDEYNKLVIEVVVPEGIEKYELFAWDDVKTLTIPLSNVAGGYSCDHVIVVQGSSTVDKLPEDKLMLFSNKNKVTLPDCVRIIDLSHFSNSKELFCSKEAEYSYEGKYTSKNPKEVMAKVDEYHQRFYKELTINGMKILD
ncbi:MAG: hypothetical protein IJS08_12435, partial [Victivallales bacterium]|nr:hypothetical protein [Victivallales bacterium]